MGRTLADIHLEIVNKLRERGETVYNPCQESMLGDGSSPKAYVKKWPFGTKGFLCGTATWNKDGSINLLPESMADLIGEGPFQLEELGLCDPVLFYAKDDRERYPLKSEEKSPDEETLCLQKFSPMYDKSGNMVGCVDFVNHFRSCGACDVMGCVAWHKRCPK
jgi:hypothetical protein